MILNRITRKIFRRKFKNYLLIGSSWLLILFTYIVFGTSKTNSDGSYEFKNFFAKLAGGMAQNKLQSVYYPNNVWMFNNNVLQYSSYTLKDKTDIWFEILINLNNRVIKDTTIDELICMIKSKNSNQIGQLKILDIITISPTIKKILIPVKQNEYDLDDIAIAVIRRDDYTKYAYDTAFRRHDFNVLPIEVVNFQTPVVVEVNEERQASVAQCIRYTQSFPSSLSSWASLQKQYGMAEIVFYDLNYNNPDKMLERKLWKNITNLITIKPYDINIEFVCGQAYLNLNILTQPALYSYYNSICKDYLIYYFNEDLVKKHEAITLTDCYIRLGYTYEFVVDFNVDEFIFPRRLTPISIYEQNKNIVCTDETRRDVCQKKAFDFDLYSYIREIVHKNYQNAYDTINMISIEASIYLVSNEFERNLIKNLTGLINDEQKFLDSKRAYVLTYDDIVSRMKQTFIVETSDLKYIKYFLKTYMSLQCFVDNWKMTAGDPDYLRFIYFITHIRQQKNKFIYYTKNLPHLLGRHTPDRKTAKVHTNIANGEFLAIFHSTELNLDFNFELSVRSMYIDFEWFSYFAQHFTNMCAYLGPPV